VGPGAPPSSLSTARLAQRYRELGGPSAIFVGKPLGHEILQSVVAVVPLECFDVEKVVQNPPTLVKHQNS